MVICDDDEEEMQEKAYPVLNVNTIDDDKYEGGVKYYSVLVGDGHQWITEAHARYTCPNKLEAYCNGEEPIIVDEDNEYLQPLLNPGKSSVSTKASVRKIKTSLESQHHIDSIDKYPSSIKKTRKGQEDEYIDLGGGLEGANRNVMGKKRRQKQDFIEEEDNLDSDESKLFSSENSSCESIDYRRMSNKKSKQMRDEFRDTKETKPKYTAPRANKFLQDLVDESIFQSLVPLRIRSYRNLKNTTPGESGWIFNVEFRSLNASEPICHKVAYEDVKKHAPHVLCDYFIRHTTIVDEDGNEIK